MRFYPDTMPTPAPEKLKELRQAFERATDNSQKPRPAYPTISEQKKGEEIKKMNEAASQSSAHRSHP